MAKLYIIMLKLLVVFFYILEVASGNFELLILHNNDMHGRFEEISKTSGTCTVQPCYGGFARTAHYVREAREKAANGTGPKVLYLNAGDTYTGTVWFKLFRWEISADFLNSLKPDAACLGNHEFDEDIPGLIPFIQAVKFPMLTTNLDLSEEPELEKTKLKNSTVLEVDGHKIGIIGYLTPETESLSITGNIKFKDEVESIKAESEALKKQGVNIIIALGHSGFAADKKIAAEVPLVDVVVGGHTNTFLYNGKPPDREVPEGPYPIVISQKNGKKVPVVQAYAYTKYMGELKVTFDDQGNVIEFSGQPVLLDNSIKQDEDILAKLEKYRPRVDEIKKQVVGKTRVFLEGDYKCRKEECNLGNLICDAMVAYHVSHLSQKLWTDAPIALLHGGGIRNSIDPKSRKGNITMTDILDVMPFDDTYAILSYNGSDLIKILEYSVGHKYDRSVFGGFLQVSGLKLVYDISRPVGSRVISASARCGSCQIPIYEPIRDDQYYRVLMPMFLSNGGDEHEIIKNNGLNKTLTEYNDAEVLAWYISEKGPVYSEIDERISFSTQSRVTSGVMSFRNTNVMFLLTFVMLAKHL